MIIVETQGMIPEDILSQINDDVIVDYCYKNNILPKPKDYVPLNKCHREYINVEVDEDDCLDEMWKEDVLDYVNKNNLINPEDYYDEALKNIGDDILDEYIYNLKKNHNCYTKEDILKYISEELKWKL